MICTKSIKQNQTVMRIFGPAFLALALLIATDFGVAQAANPGANNPISTPEQRMLFPDQHALVAMPQDPTTSSTAITYTDWARNANATQLDLKDSFGATLSGIAEARSATGHILSQSDEQVAIARFVGSGENNTIQVDVLTSEGVTGVTPQQFPAWSTEGAFPQASVVNSFDIASGELSPLEDASGAGHDEVVVCELKKFGQNDNLIELRPVVTVLDYTNEGEGEVVQTSLVDTSSVVAVPTALNFAADTRIACDTADLNKDGIDEVVVSYVVVPLFTGVLNGLMGVTIFSYTNNGVDPPLLEPQGSELRFETGQTTNVSCNGFFGTVDLATGDFNSDGRPDIAVSTVTVERPFNQYCRPDNNQLRPTVYVISSDDAFNLTLESKFDTAPFTQPDNNAYGNCIRSGGVCNSIRASVVSGLFVYNTNLTSGFDFNRRQLALVYNTLIPQSGNELRVHSLSVSDDLKTITENGSVVRIPQQCANPPCVSSRRYSVDAGGYVGSADIENPLWSLAITNWETENGAAGRFRLVWLKSGLPDSAGGFSIAQNTTLLNGAEIDGPVDARLPVAAWDREGKSVWLGSPVHLTLFDLIKADYIIQEPPKHTYWWPPSATNAANGQIIDVSRVQDFYVQLSDSENRNYAFTHKDQTDWTIGGSVAVTGKASVTVGADAGLFGAAKATGSVSVQGKVGYEYNENKESYESSYRSQTTTFTGSTNADDLLIAELMRLDIWRYPVSGIELEDGLNAFWEIVLPGNKFTVQGGGLNFDWYQPPHENGNVLSYPPLLGFSYIPPDCCAEFTYVEDSKEVTKAEPFLDNRLLFWDGTAATVDLQFSEESGSGSTKSYTRELKESLDIKIGYKTEASFAGSKTQAETQVDTNISNSNSWADVDTESASTNNASGFTLAKPPGNANQSYGFLPVFYLARDGSTKVTHAADLLGTGATFWPQTYGQLPDPALNLPRRFSATTPNRPDQFVWVVNESDDAQRIRGFFVRYDELSADGYPLVAGAVNDGQVIRIEANVYNYSTSLGFGGLDVAFHAVKYNPKTNAEIGERIPLTCAEGSVTQLFMDPLEMKTARCVWDTTGFGPTVSGAVQYYRIYVTLDPDNTIEEIYEGTVGPGQNNQGWGLLSVANPQDTFRTPTPTEAVPKGADVSMTEAGLALLVDDELLTETATVVREQLTPLRVCVNTDQTQTGYYQVLIWDGEPDAGGRLIADKLLPGVDANGESCTWLPDFRFSEAGEHILYAQVLEADSDALRGNAFDTLWVTVNEIPDILLQVGQGVAKGVGSSLASGDLRLFSVFSYDGGLDLSNASLVIDSVLNEIDGAGELIPGVSALTGQSLVLEARSGAKDWAVFQAPGGEKPRVQAGLFAVKGELQLHLLIGDANIMEPEMCGTQSNLTTAIVIFDGQHPPVELKISKPWRCKRNEEGKVRELILDTL